MACEEVAVIYRIDEGQIVVGRAEVHDPWDGEVESLLIFEDVEDAEVYLDEVEEFGLANGWRAKMVPIESLFAFCDAFGIGHVAAALEVDPSAKHLVGRVSVVVDVLRSL